MSKNTDNPRLLMWQLMNDTRVAMVTFVAESGNMQAVPLTIFNKEIPASVLEEQHLEQQHQLYFLVHQNSALCQSVAGGNSALSVTFGKHSSGDYAFIRGRGAISNDRKRIAELWTPVAESWFDGYEDENLRLLLVYGEGADVWHGNHSKNARWWHITKKAAGVADAGASDIVKDSLTL